MDALTLLKRDHAQMKQLFKQMEELLDGGALQAKRRLAERIIRDLSIHAAAEEQVFYPAIKNEAPDMEEKVLEALEEHSVAKWELAALDGMRPDAERFNAKMRVLIEAVRMHIEEEEEEMFPAIRKSMGRDGLMILGEALAQAKSMSPTRPHPRAPDQPPGNLFAGPVSAFLDAGKDFVRGMRRARPTASARQVRRSRKR